MIFERRLPLWLLVVLTALLAAILTLGLERGIHALRVQPTPTPSLSGPPPQVIVQLDTPEPEVAPSVLPADEHDRQIQLLVTQVAQQQVMMFLNKTILQISFALESLSVNDIAQADRELVAAKASLDEAFQLAAEDIKPQIDRERLEIGRLRAMVEINPNNLDEDLRRLRARLMNLLEARPE